MKLSLYKLASTIILCEAYNLRCSITMGILWKLLGVILSHGKKDILFGCAKYHFNRVFVATYLLKMTAFYQANDIIHRKQYLLTVRRNRYMHGYRLNNRTFTNLILKTTFLDVSNFVFPML